MDTNIAVTVIIPVYNSGLTLKRCINSVINQTLMSIEILLIDDGSNDGSETICDQYVSDFSFITTLHQENQGVSSARNKGIRLAKGNYIFFLDSDDYIEPTLLENLYNIADRYELDLLDSGYYIELENKKHKKEVLHTTKYALSSQDLPDVFAILDLKYIWAKLINTKLIKENKIYFSESMNYGEDLHFMLRFFIYVKKAGYQEVCGYHYMNNYLNALSRKYVNNMDAIWEGIYNAYEDVFKLNPCYKEKYYLKHMSLKALRIVQSINNLYKQCSPINTYERRQLIKNILANEENLQYIYNIPDSQKPKGFKDKIYIWVIKMKSIYTIDIIFKIKEYLIYCSVLK